MLAVLDHFGIERTVAVGHSLGACIVARLAADYPQLTRQAILIDGGLTITIDQSSDPRTLLAALLEPALARLRMRFPTREKYHQWWRDHPATRGSDVTDDDLRAYADHDLVGEPPALRSSITEAALRRDTAELFDAGQAAHRVGVPAKLLLVPHERQLAPTPMPSLDVVDAWVSAAPDRERIVIADCNHYTVIMGAHGANAVAALIRTALS
jgi:pimeloyl-ACP methyl ester carboxylesterase